MSFYGDLALTADDLLKEFGQAVTIRTQTPGEYDPATGTSAVAVVDTVGNGCVFDFGLHQPGQSFAPESMIVAGDKQLLLSPVGMATPANGSIAIIGADQWNIVSVKTTAPAGVAVLFECQLRK